VGQIQRKVKIISSRSFEIPRYAYPLVLGLNSVSLHPFTKIFGPVYGARVAEIIVDLTLTQERLLIEGRIESEECLSLTPSELKKLTGIAYLSGGDTWVDGERLSKHSQSLLAIYISH